MGGDPLPGVPKACFCSQEDDEDDKPFFFDAKQPDPTYNLKASYGRGVKKLSNGHWNFKKSYITFSGRSLQIKNKRNSKEENKEAMPTHDFEI